MSESGGTGVVVGIDGSEGAAAALAWAHSEAQRRGLELTALLAWGYLDQHHADGSTDFRSDYDEEQAGAALEAFVQSALGADAAAVTRSVVCDLPARALVDASERAALVVVGARGMGGFKGLLLGSNSQQVLHHARCPVAVIREGATEGAPTGRVVVGVDASPASAEALRWAIDEARAREAELVIVHAWQLPYLGVYPYVGEAYDGGVLERAAAETVDGLLAEAGVPDGLAVTRRLVHEPPARAILDAGADADLIVVGARGSGGFKGMLLGSVSHHVANHAPCPVVVVRPGASH